MVNGRGKVENYFLFFKSQTLFYQNIMHIYFFSQNNFIQKE